MTTGPRSFSQRLTVRLGVSLCLGAAVIMIGAGVANLRVQRSHLTRVLQLTGEQTAQVIRGATRDAMMRNHPEDVLRIIQTIAGQQDVALIRVFDKQGHIRKSSRPDEIGTLVDTDAEQCFACHVRDEPIARLQQEDRTRVFTNPDGSRMLGVIAPIENEPKCSNASCHAHPASQRVLGVLDVHLPLGPVDEAIAVTERQTIMGVAATALAVLIMVSILVWHMVLKPVRRLTSAASMAAAGVLPPSVPVTSSDELGRLSTAWNDMVAELDRARLQLERWGKDLEKKIQQKTAELETVHQQMLLVEKMAALGKLAAVMAHEINNPLEAIGNYLALLDRERVPEEKRRRYLGLVRHGFDRIRDIVRDLASFTRPEDHGGIADIAQVVRRALVMARYSRRFHRSEVELVGLEGPVRVIGEAGRLEQVFINLLLNAARAAGERGHIRIDARRIRGEADTEGPSGELVEIRVEDDGPGIPEEDLGRIFDPFFTRTSPEVDRSSLGLGLFISYGIIDAHGGTLWAENRAEGGARFVIRLPAAQETREDGTARRAAGGSERASSVESSGE